MKKIAVLANSFHTTGISSVILNYCLNLNKNKYSITILACEPINEEYVKLCEENEIEFCKLPKKGIKYYSMLFKDFKKKKYDVIHVHGSSATIFNEILIGKICGIPKRIAHSHNTTCNHKIIHRILKPLLNHCVTDRIGCGVDAAKWLYGNKKSVILNNGIDTQKFKYKSDLNTKLRTELKIPDDAFVIGHIGRMNFQKNQEYLITLFNKLSECISNLYLLLIGDGPDFQKNKEIKEKSKFSKNIIMLGETSKPQEYYNVMDLFLMPSRYEGLPVVLVEAQSNGIKCIVSNNVTKEANITESLEFFDLNNMDKIEKMVKEYIIDKNRNKEEQSKKNIEILDKKGFNIYKNVEILEKIYDKEK